MFRDADVRVFFVSYSWSGFRKSQIEEDLGDALRAQANGSSSAGLGHGSYSLKAGTGLAAAAGAGDGEVLDRDSEKLLQVISVFRSDRAFFC